VIRRAFSVIFAFFTLTTSYLLLATNVLADGEFATSYNVHYDVDSSGGTQVVEGITLKNLTDRFYASSFSLTIGATNVTEVSAIDSQGPMPVTVTKEGNKTKIDVKFNQQISGMGKEYPWTLKFKSSDFAEEQGKIWQVSVPRIAETPGLENYSLTLSVPVSFGDPTSIIPPPQKQTESAGKLNLYFSKNQLEDSGILANFGTDQVFSYKLTFNIVNDGVVPSLIKLPLPANTEYQDVLINNITPKPENVILDKDGNYIGYFKVPQKQKSQVVVEGLAKLRTNNSRKDQKLTPEQISEYTSSEKYWDKDTPQIKDKLKEIFKEGEPKTNTEKARLINNYVVNTLTYDNEKLKRADFERLGALTVLANPTNAMCSEFTDLFISLARAAGIPSRMKEGFAYSSNNEIRPVSFEGTVLHAWPEYYDENKGWVMIDPTWQNTTGGVDYFSKFDLNHFVFDTRGFFSEEPTTADQAIVEFSDAEFTPNPKLDVGINTPSEIFAGLPFKTRLRFSNQGNYLENQVTFKIGAAKLQLKGLTESTTPSLPPFGFVEYSYDTKTNSLWESFGDAIIVDYKDPQTGMEKQMAKSVWVKSFFSYNNFTFVTVAVVGGIGLFYLGILVWHFKKTWKKPQ
jgi:transglutaminase-like putative cysteine protease